MLAASSRIGPWTAQASTPQLTNTTFLPDGIGLPTGSVTVSSVGRSAAFCTTALAFATPAADAAESVDVPLVSSSLPPHAGGGQ